ncbi:MAG: hypothetical protein ABIL37_01645 [candidate division WOR-3 bacterium]
MRKLIFIVLISCTYSLVGFFPREYRDISLMEIENKTDYLQLTSISKVAFENFVLNEPRLNLRSKGNANVLVKIYINSYSREPEKYDQNGNIISYKYGVYIDVEYLKKDSIVIFEKRGYSGFYVQPALNSPDDGYKNAIIDALSKSFSDYFNTLSKD